MKAGGFRVVNSLASPTCWPLISIDISVKAGGHQVLFFIYKYFCSCFHRTGPKIFEKYLRSPVFLTDKHKIFSIDSPATLYQSNLGK